jgi:hypothetical protein
VPQDINLDPSMKSAPAGGESLKVDKPLSPQAERNALDSSKPSSPKDAQGSPGAGGARLLQPVLPQARTLQVLP